jgi:hypothetical protein
LIGIRISNFLDQEKGTISRFFRNDSEAMTDPYVCPICLENIFSKDEKVLSDHVLSCSSTDKSPKV